MPSRWQAWTRRWSPSGPAVGVLRGERVDEVVAPAPRPRELADRHQLDGGDPQLEQGREARDDRVEGPLGRERADVDLVEDQVLPLDPLPIALVPGRAARGTRRPRAGGCRRAASASRGRAGGGRRRGRRRTAGRARAEASCRSDSRAARPPSAGDGRRLPGRGPVRRVAPWGPRPAIARSGDPAGRRPPEGSRDRRSRQATSRLGDFGRPIGAGRHRTLQSSCPGSPPGRSRSGGRDQGAEPDGGRRGAGVGVAEGALAQVAGSSPPRRHLRRGLRPSRAAR